MAPPYPSVSAATSHPWRQQRRWKQLPTGQAAAVLGSAISATFHLPSSCCAAAHSLRAGSVGRSTISATAAAATAEAAADVAVSAATSGDHDRMQSALREIGVSAPPRPGIPPCSPIPGEGA